LPLEFIGVTCFLLSNFPEGVQFPMLAENWVDFNLAELDRPVAIQFNVGVGCV
jgi:hypothetical protein